MTQTQRKVSLERGQEFLTDRAQTSEQVPRPQRCGANVPSTIFPCFALNKDKWIGHIEANFPARAPGGLQVRFLPKLAETVVVQPFAMFPQFQSPDPGLTPCPNRHEDVFGANRLSNADDWVESTMLTVFDALKRNRRRLPGPITR